MVFYQSLPFANLINSNQKLRWVSVPTHISAKSSCNRCKQAVYTSSREGRKDVLKARVPFCFHFLYTWKDAFHESLHRFLILPPLEIWLFIIYYMYITFTFRNNCLQSGNSHWVWFSVLLHLRYRKSIWNKETEIKYCSCTKICLWYPCVLQVLRPSMRQINKVVNLRTFQDVEKKSAKQNKQNFC